MGCGMRYDDEQEYDDEEEYTEGEYTGEDGYTSPRDSCMKKLQDV